jgi:transposase-like protein
VSASPRAPVGIHRCVGEADCIWRCPEIDDAILSCYLGGVNDRRVRTALKPRLGERHLSKSAVSRIVGRWKALFATWQGCDLSTERYPIVFFDGFHLKLRVARRVLSVPVLAAFGVTETGQKCLLTLRVVASEASATWAATVTDLQQRGLAAPLLLIVDGNAGPKHALKQWDDVRVPRCTTHKLDNLRTHCRDTPRLSCNAITIAFSMLPTGSRHARRTMPS